MRPDESLSHPSRSMGTRSASEGHSAAILKRPPAGVEVSLSQPLG
jgi:hypothetical protein